MRRNILAALLSAVFPGLGQVYGGEVQRGVFILFLTVVIDVALIFLLQWIILVPLWHAFVIYDAYKILEEKEEVIEAEEETEEETYVKLEEMV